MIILKYTHYSIHLFVWILTGLGQGYSVPIDHTTNQNSSYLQTLSDVSLSINLSPSRMRPSSRGETSSPSFNLVASTSNNLFPSSSESISGIQPKQTQSINSKLISTYPYQSDHNLTTPVMSIKSTSSVMSSTGINSANKNALSISTFVSSDSIQRHIPSSSATIRWFQSDVTYSTMWPSASINVLASGYSITYTSSSLHSSVISQLIKPSPTVVSAATVGFANSSLTFVSNVHSPVIQTTYNTRLPPVSRTNQPDCSSTRSCCAYGLSQLMPSITFEESMPSGYVIIEMKGIHNVSIDLRVVRPLGVEQILRSYFTITNTGSICTMSLRQEMDLEELYLKTNKQADVHKFQIQLTCLENGVVFPSRIINVTVEDVDDSMPVFEHDGSGPSCVVPVYKAGTDEDYTGELVVSPGRIKAVDGDLTKKHNITYTVIHSEPDNYHVYFNVNSINGTVNKTRHMNVSDPRKYVLFVQAMEDSPNQKNRVAILTIEVYAPLEKNEKPITVDPVVKSALQIISALVLIAFASGFLVIIHHRYRRRRLNNESKRPASVEQDTRLPKLAVYKSSTSSLNSVIPDIPEITSPSQVDVKHKQKVLEKRKKVIVKKPLDTSARPGWNARPPKARKLQYNPYTSTTVQKIKQK